MKTKRLLYIVNARLPTEKAHGYQISKMCEAFAENGIESLLVHPYRYQSSPELSQQTVFDYYGVHRVFEILTLKNLDVLHVRRLTPNSIFVGLFFIHAVLWGLYASLAARREKADLYYTRGSEIAYWLVRLGLPTVYEAHGVPKRGQRLLLRRIASHRALRLVVGLTSFIKQRFIEMGFPNERVMVLPDGVDLSLFEELPNIEECRLRLGLPPHRPIVGYIGRFKTLEMEKGIPELVRAMNYVPSIGGEDPLLLCVGGPLDAVPAYRDIARRSGLADNRLQFVDRVPNWDVPLWIRACDVVTIPWPWTEFSAYFTSPLKLFEYMAAGVPIVASDLPSLRDVLRPGENAMLVGPGDTRALGQAIRAVLEDVELAGRLGEQARRDAKNYTWNRRTAAILKAVRIKELVIVK
jgi:glycosyltransferase involved in cell wall biosynthesis